MLIATAGHVDHGKTVLVKTLTGVDTDRLPEEKERGLSIDIGFAYTTLGSDDVIGFVDVPGHERFVRNMLAGVASIDCALLVVAVDDGPMPQTREHLAILDLLRVREGAIALTKIDLAEPGRVEEVTQQITGLVAGTVLEDAPIFPVSAQEQIGIDDLDQYLRLLAEERSQREKRAGSKFRLAIDRDFSVHGAGRVVTGAVFAGEVQVGDRLALAPAGVEVRIRGIHAQNQTADVGTVGQRCALNITGPELNRTQIHRGDWLVSAPGGEATRRFDANLQCLASEDRPVAHWTPVHVHLASASLTGRVAVLEGKSIPPGETGLVQIVLDQPTMAVHGDRFILRDQSARRTIAGGDIIDPYGPQRGRAKPERIAAINAMQTEDPSTALNGLVGHLPNGLDLDEFTHGWNLQPSEAQSLFEGNEIVEIAVRRARLGFARSDWNQIADGLLAGLQAWHSDHQDQVGPDETRLRLNTDLGRNRDVVTAVIAALVRDGKILRDGTSLRLPSHEASLSPRDQALWDKLEQYVTAAELKPPVVTELASQLGLQKEPLVAFLSRSVGRGQLVRVAPNRFYHPKAVRTLARIAEEVAAGSASGLFDAKAYRDASGIGRNLTIQVLEYFDGTGLTRRIGDERRLIKSSDEIFGRA